MKFPAPDFFLLVPELQPRVVCFVQLCPSCQHPTVARTELRTHEAMVEHWEFKHT